MKIRANPNRMQLLRLRRRLTLAQRGHKLLKDKQEELMRRFLGIVHEARDARNEIEKELVPAHRAFVSARFDMDGPAMESALAFSRRTVSLRADREQVMNLKVPVFSVEFDEDAELGYGYLDTTGDLDRALSLYATALPKLMKLAELEKSVQLIAAELEKTRRRVNALEHILIPSLEETIRFISDRLSELERATATRLMKVKEIVREH
ncbi:MAG: V-type ATP synthase subunit D [Candidatus Eisenbacteria bacterium]|nr:V-type ATP synthase subunit D [Candidatus Eisenbacteria bacterium]